MNVPPYVAQSIAGQGTTISWPGMNISFDIGYLTKGIHGISRIAITHGHFDHIGYLIQHLVVRHRMEMGPAEYWLPYHLVRPVRELLRVWSEITGPLVDCKLHPAVAGTRFNIRKDLEAKAFKATHVVPTLGYLVYETRNKLRPELVGLPSTEIAKRVQSGETVSNSVVVPAMAFCGDTTAKVLDQEPELYEVEDLVLECSFMGTQNVDKASARAHGHIHLDDLIDRADCFQNKRLLLTHTSVRYSQNEIFAEMAKVPENMKSRLWVLTHNGQWHKI